MKRRASGVAGSTLFDRPLEEYPATGDHGGLTGPHVVGVQIDQTLRQDTTGSTGMLAARHRHEDTLPGTPQGGILSPVLANIALSVLDDHCVDAWQATMVISTQRTRSAHDASPTVKPTRDWSATRTIVASVAGTREHVEAHRSAAMPSRAVLHRVNAVLRGWCNYFRHRVSKATLNYLDEFAWRPVTRWLRRRHHGLT